MLSTMEPYWVIIISPRDAFNSIWFMTALKSPSMQTMADAVVIHAAGLITIGNEITKALYNVNVTGTKSHIQGHFLQDILYILWSPTDGSHMTRQQWNWDTHPEIWLILSAIR